jgi:hypothetical protein
MKQTVWAIKTKSTEIDGAIKNYIEVRLQKQTMLNIPYSALQFDSFDDVKSWSKGKEVDIKYGQQENGWNKEAGLFMYGKVEELVIP